MTKKYGQRIACDLVLITLVGAERTVQLYKAEVDMIAAQKAGSPGKKRRVAEAMPA